jgi:spastin
MSRYLGEGEKLMRGLFQLAEERAPTVIFFDEIDSLLSARSNNEHEASRRMKTEFLVQLDGVNSDTENVLVLAATNRPFDLDSAALRRLPKRILIGLPDEEVIESMLRNYMKTIDTDFEDDDSKIEEVASMLKGLSAGDIKSVIQAAAMAPINEIEGERFMSVKKEDLRQVTVDDFRQAFEEFIPSYDALASYEEYKKWGREAEK